MFPICAARLSPFLEQKKYYGASAPHGWTQTEPPDARAATRAKRRPPFQRRLRTTPGVISIAAVARLLSRWRGTHETAESVAVCCVTIGAESKQQDEGKKSVPSLMRTDREDDQLGRTWLSLVSLHWKHFLVPDTHSLLRASCRTA